MTEPRKDEFEAAALARMAQPFTTHQISIIAQRHGYTPDWCKKTSALRAADLLIQRLRKKGKIAYRREGRAVVWTLVEPWSD